MKNIIAKVNISFIT